MNTLFDRLIAVTVFLVSIMLTTGIVGLMASSNHAETPWWVLAALGLSSGIASVGACMWGAKHDNHG